MHVDTHNPSKEAYQGNDTAVIKKLRGNLYIPMFISASAGGLAQDRESNVVLFNEFNAVFFK